jgi:hypothetical protein
VNELSLKASDFPSSVEFDALMRANFDKDQLAVHLDNGTFYTSGTKEWDDSPDIRDNPGFRIKNWTFDTQSGATLAWDWERAPLTEVPLALIRTTEMSKDLARVNLHTDEEIWLGQPRGQTVRDLTLDLQFSKALPRWRAAGKMLRIGACALGGHSFAMERLHLKDFGAHGYEGFPLYGQGAYGMYDRDAIARLDPTTHIFDEGVTETECSHITDCLADGFVESSTNDQVTVRFIGGSIGNPVSGDLSRWTQTPRAFSYQRGNRTVAAGQWVQAHTIYNCLRGEIDHNSSSGAAVGVYGDFCRNKGLHIWLNQFLGCDYSGIRLLLSPTGPGNLAEQFSHEDYDIGPNEITSRSGVQVDFNTFEEVLPTGPTRFIRNMRVDSSLTLENKGGVGVTRSKSRGCLLFFLPSWL